MNQSNGSVKFPWNTLRQLGNTPSYFFLIWRWTFWLFAFIWITSDPGSSPQAATGRVLLIVTFVHTLIITLYAPVFQIFLSWLPGVRALHITLPYSFWSPRKTLSSSPLSLPSQEFAPSDEVAILTPLIQTRSSVLNFSIYALDVVICGLVTYYGGSLGNPYFGDGSPFYRYGFSAAFAAAFAYNYRGGLLAALGYEAFILFGVFNPPPGAIYHLPNVVDLEGSFFDLPIASLLAAYLASMLAKYLRNNLALKYNVDIKSSLVQLGDMFVRGADDKARLIRESAAQMCLGGHFQSLVIALLHYNSPDSTIPSLADSDIFATPASMLLTPDHPLIQRVLQSGQKIASFAPVDPSDSSPGLAQLYLPLYKEGKLYMILGVENRSVSQFDQMQEEFLRIAGNQLLIALENIQLVAVAAEMAKEAERVRIAREMHDGVAQLMYMLSLNSETCAAFARRLSSGLSNAAAPSALADPEESPRLLQSLVEQLDRQVVISKQALLETRQYMFTLKPLMSGVTTLKQMLSSQVREFSLISDLSVDLQILGDDELHPHGHLQHHKLLQAEMAIFRIVQEALNNTYKHAQATQASVVLTYLQQAIEVEIVDDGCGLATQLEDSVSSSGDDQLHIYSGHGLRNMCARVNELDGSWKFIQVPTGGVTIKVLIPL